jgi:hypothetical protein
MKHLLTYLTLCIIALTGMHTLQAKKGIALPSKGEVQQMLMNSRWYIAKGEGPGGAILVGGTYEFSSTRRRVTFGRETGTMKYAIVSVRPSQSGMSYFFDLKINTDEGKSWVEECMVKPSGSIIIRKDGFSPYRKTNQSMYLEIVAL